MTKYPEIPAEIRPFLKHARAVATAIAKDQSMVQLMKTVYRQQVKRNPEIRGVLSTLTYTDICDALRPYASHPDYGVLVQVVLEGGEDWVERHLKALREEFL